MSPRTVGEYERTGPRTYKLGLFNAVFDGELLRGTVFDGSAPAGTNGTKVPAPVEDDALTFDMAADQVRHRGRAQSATRTAPTRA